jgi:structural maintenance of chromosome 3 (chondroitin sulfate proteoglycan 6)
MYYADETAARLMKKMESERLGRLTFLPLNRLKQTHKELPRDDDYFPLLDKLNYDRNVEAAMQQVFGKKLLCRSMEVASEVSERFEVDAVTLEGDEVNRRGGLHGGYIDVRRSRIKAMDSVRQAKEDLGNISTEVSEKQKEQN